MKDNPYIRLMRFDKPVGILLLIFPTLMALLMATQGMPDLKSVIIFTLGVAITRAAGCILNDIADRNIDGQVERTKNRPLANKEISVFSALVLFVILAIVGLVLLYFLPPITYVWAALCLILMIIYPLSKRFFAVPQLFLGLAFSMPIPMVYANYGINPLANIDALLLFFANVAWTIAYDTQYAIADMDDDLREGKIHSSAITFGRHVNKIVFLLNFAYLALLALLGWKNHFSYLFYVGLGINLLWFIYHYFNVNSLDGATGFKAFMQNISIGWITLWALALGLIGMQAHKYQETINNSVPVTSAPVNVTPATQDNPPATQDNPPADQDNPPENQDNPSNP
ncbi:4-hydroxybenzoate polyprenyltransferase [Psittacicella melopsittaci]|uniref:4-hydroxybenzoate octaprenyltransferase n=1 Tax=Psittacicella melopsittaci TaxID=2028576 RepID=A0A3A1Y4N7_9GAMM|nr:4-hydroxybenzoate octaprenyltransferase [Psittacicella melopsittaci]RIY33262.1 4-hydroxybenzoate polyprenyltransferase [Psittacicella melopsittaci]